MQLTNVVARKIVNSRKEATIEVVAESNRVRAIASAPSGASKGKYEVKDFSSRGIDFSINFLNVLGRKLINEKILFESFNDIAKIEEIVKKYDRTKNLEFVGGNSLYALEAAVVKLLALSQQQEPWKFLLGNKKVKMPKAIGNCIGGGLHSKQAQKTDFQEFLLLPKTAKFFDAVFIMQQTYKEIKEILAKKDLKWKGTLTDENAFASTLDNENVLELLEEMKEKIKEKFDLELELGIDVAASTFFKAQSYHYSNFSQKENKKILSRDEQISYIAELAKKHTLSYVEDPLESEDFEGFSKLRSKSHALICGDDLICTHLERIGRAIKAKAINATIIKPNQVASLIETKKVVELAKSHDIIPVISHRSGETTDYFIADLAVGWNIPFIKAGIRGKEREAKLNRLIKIEKVL